MIGQIISPHRQAPEAVPAGFAARFPPVCSGGITSLPPLPPAHLVQKAANDPGQLVGKTTEAPRIADLGVRIVRLPAKK